MLHYESSFNLEFDVKDHRTKYAVDDVLRWRVIPSAFEEHRKKHERVARYGFIISLLPMVSLFSTHYYLIGLIVFPFCLGFLGMVLTIYLDRKRDSNA